ncbi:MAG: beta-glucosidase [Acidimicrobiaceae bacterium]|nr:beta-glucosidase [Acidimicrobiaceae bacterium]
MTSTPSTAHDAVDRDAIYRDATRPVTERIADLLGRMTLDEKLAQLGSVWIFQIADGERLDTERATPLLEHGIGHVTRMSGASSLTARQAAGLADDLQRHLVDHTRLGIPALVHEEICSGLMAREATIYPQAIGVAAGFRPEHNRALADTIRLQMRSIGAHQGLSPVLDVCRDPRWGRLEETYGEDPCLVSRMGVEFIRGLQGDDLTAGVIATAKHFVGYGASEGGMNWAPAHLPERELRDVYLRPFEAAVCDAGLESVMNGYHELDGVPCGANRWLLTDLLRGEWGFDGTVVSDYFAVKQLFEYHHVVADADAAAVLALHAGLDVELPSTEAFGSPLAGAVERGEIPIEVIDRAVERALASKFRLGLFESPYVGREHADVHTRTPAQRELAAQIARDSLVLVKNDGVLPLAAPSTVAVIGPNADSARLLLGDYSYPAHVESLIEVLKSGQNVFAMPIDQGVGIEESDEIARIPTVLDALRRHLPTSDVVHSEGCAVNSDDRSGFAAAVELAARSDVTVLVVGERSGLTDDCTTGESRDVATLDLPGVQEELVHAVAATGTPVVIVLVSGRPIGSPAVHEAANAVLLAWLPGECGADAIAEALTGEVSPGGRLPVSYPRGSGQVPVFYSHKVSGGRSHWKGEYVDMSNEPLYPFGHGLSYSTFDLVPQPLDGPEVAVGAIVTVAVEVHNTGDRTADEVVQLYSRDPVAPITRPVLELQDFVRVTLEPGAAATVRFELPVAALGYTGVDMTYVVDPGDIELFVGRSSAELVPAGHLTVVGTEPMSTRRSTGRATVDDPTAPDRTNTAEHTDTAHHTNTAHQSNTAQHTKESP